jgi:glycosyltransferase involved in cell wall biosynthesis
VCVSSVHREEIQKRLGVERRIFIVPCFADEAVFDCGRHVKNDVRAHLGIAPGEMVFVYSGIVPAQYDEFNPIHFFAHLGDTQGKRLLVLAADSESIERTDRQISPSIKDRIIVVSVPRLRVPEYLCACDVGILLRKASIVNYVASPTKFAEYLLCGLPVVITESLGDATSLVRRDNIGSVVSGTNSVDSLSEKKWRALLSKETKARARASGLANLSHKSCRPLLLEVFEATLIAK